MTISIQVLFIDSWESFVFNAMYVSSIWWCTCGIDGFELNASFENMLRLQEISQGMNLVGKTVQYEDAGELKSGRVDEFFTSEGAINLMVDGNSVPINQVIGVTADPA